MGNLLTFAKAIIALAQVLPFASQLFDAISDLWIDSRIKKFDKEKATRAEKRRALMKAIKEAKTDEDRKALSIILADISK